MNLIVQIPYEPLEGVFGVYTESVVESPNRTRLHFRLKWAPTTAYSKCGTVLAFLYEQGRTARPFKENRIVFRLKIAILHIGTEIFTFPEVTVANTNLTIWCDYNLSSTCSTAVVRVDLRI